MAGTGRQSKTSPRSIATAQRRAQALKMRLDGARYDEITQQLGYSSRGAAVQDVQRALVATVQEPADEVRALELSRLDMMWQTVIEVLRKEHVIVSQGRVVFLDDEPIKDTGPILAAVDRLLKIQERRAKYLGLDAPKQLEVVTLDAIDQQIRALNEELERAAANGEAEVGEGADELDGVEAGTAAGAAPATG
jgi:hypothetical protein